MANPVPSRLLVRPFTTQQAADARITSRMLRGRRFRQLFRGVHIAASLEITLLVRIRAALLLLPLDAAASHVTALRLFGVEIGCTFPLHFSTNSLHKCTISGIRLHRRRGRLAAHSRGGFACLGPDRTFVDSATVLSFVQLVQAGDWLLHLQRTTHHTLGDYLAKSHIDGVTRARRAFAYVRERVESPMETLVRLIIVFARLVEPDTNRDILDDAGRFVARGDMPYFRWKVLVEYDGEWHERSRKQRARDRTRRADLERLGWTVVVILVEDLSNKREIVWRVYRALRARGYAGPAPHFNDSWTRWFA